MKSRLEELKTNHEFRKGEGWDVTTLPEDIDWLIEQLEQAEKERLKAYHDGYKQGRFDAEADAICEPTGFSEEDALSKMMEPLEEED